eukprot:gene1026-614_t
MSLSMSLSRELLSVSLLDGEPWRPSPFQPPPFRKEYPSQLRRPTLVASAQPWYPAGLSPVSNPVPSPVQLSPVNSFSHHPGDVPHLSADFSASDSTIFSPLSTPVSTVFHAISDAAAARRVYPVHMFLSARKDASHTPHGILQWCTKQYRETPTLKVPPHLALSLHEASEAPSARGVLGTNAASSRARSTRQLHSKVMYILSRITPQKYNELLDELLQLPLRQADDAELEEVVNVFFEKASDEPEYSQLYARLVQVLCTGSEAEAALEPELQMRVLSNRLRDILGRTWEQRLQLHLHVTEDDKVDRSTGAELDAEELEKKVSRMKSRLVGSAIFFAELICIDVVPAAAMRTILYRLVGTYNSNEPLKTQECAFELFNKFLKAVSAKLLDFDPELLGHYLATAKCVGQTHPRCRVRFMMEELEKLRVQNHWPIADPAAPPPTAEKASSTSAVEFNDGLSSSSVSVGLSKSKSDDNSLYCKAALSPATLRSPTTSGISPLMASADQSMDVSIREPLRPSFSNLLLRYLMFSDDGSLSLFRELSAEGKKLCFFEFFQIIFTTDSPVIAQVPQLFAYLIPHYLKSVTLSCILIAYLRDEAPRQCELYPRTLERVAQLIQHHTVQAAVVNYPHAKQLYYMSYFNLILVRLSRSSYPVEGFLAAAYPAYTQMLKNIPNASDPVANLSAACLSILRFLYAVLPKALSGSGRIEAPLEAVRGLQTQCPALQNSIELTVYEMAVAQGHGWEGNCAAAVLRAASLTWSPVAKLITVMNAMDALLTCTAVTSSRGGPILSVPSAAHVASCVIKHLDCPLYEAAIVLELVLHCNQYPFTYLRPRPATGVELLRQLFGAFSDADVFPHKGEALRLVRYLDSNEKSTVSVYLLSLFTRQGLSISKARLTLSQQIRPIRAPLILLLYVSGFCFLPPEVPHISWSEIWARMTGYTCLALYFGLFLRLHSPNELDSWLPYTRSLINTLNFNAASRFYTSAKATDWGMAPSTRTLVLAYFTLAMKMNYTISSWTIPPFPPSFCATGRSQSSVQCAAPTTGTFRPEAFTPFKLIASRYETHDTRRFIFALGSPEETFDLPVASCIVAKFMDADGKEVLRPYTPISSGTTKGHFELLVKRYPKGKMGNHLFNMKPGEELLVKGPYEKLPYKPNMWRHVGMLAGGTGITPMYQIIRRILENEKDKTQVSLVFANNKREDILLGNELVELNSTFKKSFNLYFTLCEVPKRWLGGIGYITREMIETFMPAPKEKNTMILVSGPPAMMKAVSGLKDEKSQGQLSGLLRDMGYSADQVFKF